MRGIFEDTLVNMNWTEVGELAGRGALALLPLGVIEEHGPHLCLGTDIYTAYIHSALVKEELARRGLEAVIAPPFYWGVCQSTGGFIGSFHIRKETAKALLVDILGSLAGFGFKNVFGVNAHGDIDYQVAILEAFKEANETFSMRACFPFPQHLLSHYGLSGDEPHVCAVAPQTLRVSEAACPDVHAGDIETATIHHFYPGLMNVERAKTLPPTRVGDDQIWPWLLGGHTQELSPNGYLGSPAEFETVRVAEHAHDVAARVAESIVAKVNVY